MKLKYFFRVSWTIQLLVGLGLFLVSFLIESSVLQSFIAAPVLAILLAITLETGKAVAIVWHRYLNSQPEQHAIYPRSAKIISASFRSGLVGLSALCSLLYLAGHLDRPHLTEVRNADLKQVEQQFTEDSSRLNKNLLAQRQQLKDQHLSEYSILKENYGQRVTKLENDLENEMNNVVKGIFKGKRYYEIESQLHAAQKKRDAALQTLTQTQANQFRQLEQELKIFEIEQMDKLRQSSTTQRASINNSDYAVDARVNDSRIVSFLTMAESVFNVNVLPLQFVFAFSLLMSLLMEMGIMLAFETITVAVIPALSAQHSETLRKEVLETQLDGEMDRDASEHAASVSKIRNTADRVMEKAQEYMSAAGT